MTAATSPTQYDDRAVKQMIYPAIVFMAIGMLVGVYLSFNGFLAADYFSGEYVHFGRVRPVHVGHVTLLWLLAADMGLMYFFVPRLCGVPLWSPKLATVSNSIWWAGSILGVYSYPFGTNWGWEYAELPMLILGWIPIKAIVSVAWILFALNLFMTISNRRFKKMYVSLWYTMGTLIWTSFTFLVGNFAIEFVPQGISRVNTNFFYVHNLVGLIFTPMGLAAAYYFIPKIANTPIYSHKLSMIGFWTISFVYAWIGAHHMLHGPESQWLQTTSIIFSMWLFIPVWTVITNLLGTIAQNWQKYTQSAAMRFLIMGVIFYLIVCAQGSLQSLRNINEVISKTDWIIGHAHMALLGAFTYFAIGGCYVAIPIITKKSLWSNKLANWHFGLVLLGSILMFFSLWVGGFWQGLMWADWATGSSYAEYHDNLSRVSFLQTIEQMRPWWIARLISGLIILVGTILFLVNIFNTIVLTVPKRKELNTAVVTNTG